MTISRYSRNILRKHLKSSEPAPKAEQSAIRAAMRVLTEYADTHGVPLLVPPGTVPRNKAASEAARTTAQVLFPARPQRKPIFRALAEPAALMNTAYAMDLFALDAPPTLRRGNEVQAVLERLLRAIDESPNTPRQGYRMNFGDFEVPEPLQNAIRSHSGNWPEYECDTSVSALGFKTHSVMIAMNALSQFASFQQQTPPMGWTRLELVNALNHLIEANKVIMGNPLTVRIDETRPLSSEDLVSADARIREAFGKFMQTPGALNQGLRDLFRSLNQIRDQVATGVSTGRA